jgi:SNF2 family DNA or RNA helicase
MTMNYLDDLRNHQREEVAGHANDPRRFLFWEPRIGKTRAAMRSAYVWAQHACRRILIVAPKTVCRTVWVSEVQNDFAALIPGVSLVHLYDGSLDKRRAMLREARKSNAPMTIAIVNQDVLNALDKDLLGWLGTTPDNIENAIIVDEIHNFRTRGSRRSRSAETIARRCYWRRGLTGTPQPRGYVDLYSQYCVIAPNVFPGTKKDFIDRYCIMDLLYPTVVGYKEERIPELLARAYSVASSMTRAECFDIPQNNPVMRYFDLPSKARRAYDKIVAEHILELRAGEEVPLAHTLQRLTALSQIATGYTRTTSNDGARLVEWLHDEKVLIARDEARDIIESGKKVIIFYRNTPEGEAIRKALEEYRPLRLDGHVRDRDRHAAIEAFHNDDDRRLIVCQEQVASLGIALNAPGAHYTIFLSSSDDYDIHKQALDRNFEQQNSTAPFDLTTVYVLARDTVDIVRMKRLQRKGEAQDAFLRRAQTDFAQVAYGAV